ncbi:MAG: hypothetical protein FWF88_11185 [Peptococcaceae bacterium]|nr:hypothetical protein [Peptococcaceae bacterium]
MEHSNGQWTNQWTMDNGQWTMDKSMDNGQWTMDNERQETKKWTMAKRIFDRNKLPLVPHCLLFLIVHCPLSIVH